MIKATTIYNRAGTGHFWTEAFMDPNPEVMRSLCGLFDLHGNLDTKSVIAVCKRCVRAHNNPK